MSRPDCTCADRMAAEDGAHEGTCPMSVMHTGKLWFRPVGGEWQTAPFRFSRSAEEERLTAELTALRQQVADLRAALEEEHAVLDSLAGVNVVLASAALFEQAETAAVHAERILAATQPQEVQP